jgi:hypothetical protein
MRWKIFSIFNDFSTKYKLLSSKIDTFHGADFGTLKDNIFSYNCKNTLHSLWCIFLEVGSLFLTT